MKTYNLFFIFLFGTHYASSQNHVDLKLDAQITPQHFYFMLSTIDPPPPGTSPSDLCGIWYSDGYDCPAGNYHREIFSISQTDNDVVCVKIIGDNCVTSGEISWQGSYVGSVFPVNLHVGSESQPNCCYVLSEVAVIDADHLRVNNSINVFRYSCDQLDSLKLRSSDYGLACDCHVEYGTLSISPNPSELFFIFNNTGKKIARVDLFNSIGQILISHEGEQSMFDLRSCSQGIYIYRIDLEDGRKFTGKIFNLKNDK